MRSDGCIGRTILSVSVLCDAQARSRGVAEMRDQTLSESPQVKCQPRKVFNCLANAF